MTIWVRLSGGRNQRTTPAREPRPAATPDASPMAANSVTFLFACLSMLVVCASAFATPVMRSAHVYSRVHAAKLALMCMPPAEGEQEPQAKSDQNGAAADDNEMEDAPVEATDGLLNSPSFLKKKVEVLEQEFERLKAENADLAARIAEEEKSPTVLRLQADFENLRRRTAEQMSEQKMASTADCIKELLPVIDNFDRAANVNVESEEALKVQNSYKQLYKQLLEIISKNLGATEIDAEGKEFDFNMHEALTQSESTDVAENHVIDVLQRGFAIGDRLIRPAMVRVSMGPGPGVAAEARASKGSSASE